jgi:hypothetical protein
MIEVLFHYAKTAIFVLVSAGLAFLSAWILMLKIPQTNTATIRTTLLLLGTSFLLVAGVGKLGWSIQTFGGDTIAENWNEGVFLFLSYGGTFLLFLDIALGVIKGRRSI